MSDDEVNESPPPTLAATRTRREKKDKGGRFAALEKLKAAKEKGKKFNYEVDEVQNVYDIVDENEYAEEVRRKRDHGWLVEEGGDEGAGYVEDGREIFDEEEEDTTYSGAAGSSYKGPRGGKSNKGEKEKKEGSKGSNIKNMLLNMPSRKKKDEDSVNINDDAVLGDILGKIKPKIGLKKAPPGGAAGRSLGGGGGNTPKSSEDRNPFLKKGTGLKKVVPPSHNSTATTTTTTASTPHAPSVVDPSQDIEEFDSCPTEEFDDDMMEMMDSEDMEGLGAEMDEGMMEGEAAAAAPDSSAAAVPAENRGFVEQKPTRTVDDKGKGWISGGVAQASSVDVKVDTSRLPLMAAEVADPTGTSGETVTKEVLRMYWLDATEDPVKHPGVVWLFGKVWIDSAKSYVSCCLTVRNIPRRIFLAKRDVFCDPKTGQPQGPGEPTAVSPMDLYSEFNDKIAKRYKIMEHKCRPVERSYAFEHADVPNVGQYLEVIYSADYPALPSDLRGETFSRVFGAPQTALEAFLLEQKLKGPGWINVVDASAAPGPPTSWCRLEALVTDPSKVAPAIKCQDDAPPLVIMSLKIGTVINSKSHQNEIAMIGVLSHTEYSLDRPPPDGEAPFNQHCCLVTRPADEAWPYDWGKVGCGPTENGITRLEKAGSERELLSLFLSKVQKLDPDLIVGHDILGFDLEVLVHRLHQTKIAHWSRIGRLRRSNNPSGGRGGAAERNNVTVGRLICDLKISAKELIRCKSYELGALVEKCLAEGEEDQRALLSPDAIRRSYASSDELKSMVMLCMRDADQTLRLVHTLQALPLALQISQIVGTVMSKTLRGGRAERVEYLLLHAFTALDYVLPDKQYGKKRPAMADHEDEDGAGGGVGGGGGKKKKASYAGGLVLDPKRGFYDKYILLLDFNSLYPSIIQEYNICFTTVDRAKSSAGSTAAAEDEMVLPNLPDPGLGAGVLPTQIRKLVESRRQVKDLLRREKLSPAQKQQLNIRQLALKLTANSMYGCLGFSFSRFYAKHLAALVTSKGREILLQTRDIIQKMNLDVIYGDTDSVMVNSNSTEFEEVFKLGKEIKQTVNKLYKLLELDIDGVYKYMLLLKKKKYAAVTIEKDSDGNFKQTTELKGLDIVRRDWSQFAADAGRAVIDIIMTDKAQDTRVAEIQSHLEELRVLLLDGKIPLKNLAITKQLTKDPSDYADKKAVPHVQVAMRLNSAGGKKLKAGDTVPYVICEDGSGLTATQRAYHVDEVKESTTLKIDTQYYLAQQLHPVVSRLCDPIEGMDSARVAQCLGLDPSQYKSARQSADDGSGEDGGLVRDEDRFLACQKLTVNCACGEEATIDSPFRGTGREFGPALLACPRAKPCGGHPLQGNIVGRVMNQVSRLARSSIQRYYCGWLVCEDPGCTGRTRQLPLQFQRAFPVCPACRKATMYAEYSDYQLYTQLQFILHLFDIRKAQTKLNSDELTYVRNKLSSTQGSLSAYDAIKEMIDQKYVKNNGYATISLEKVFQGLFCAGAC